MRTIFEKKVLSALSLVILLPGGPLRAANAGSETPVREGFVDTADGASIRYLEAGDGPALLFIPGWTLTAEIWQRQLDRFAATHRVVAIDPRGQGRSSKEPVVTLPAARGADLKAVIDGLALAPATLVCWSMAVVECVSYIDRFGTGSVAGLVLVDGIAGADFDPQLAPALLYWIGAFQRNRPMMAEVFVRSMFKRPQSEERIEQLVATTMATPTDTAVALYLGLLATDLRPALSQIDRPTLIVVAPSPLKKAHEELRRGIPQARFVRFEKAGHALFIDEAEPFDTLLAGFLAEIAAATAAEK